MRRDMDVIRQLLLHIESDDVFDGSSTGVVTAAEVELPAQVVTYHMKLLADAGYVDVADWLASGDPIIRGLTWQGHTSAWISRPRVTATALLVSVWLLLDHPWGLCAFVALAALYGLTELHAKAPAGWSVDR
jgi:hypothetical protein